MPEKLGELEERIRKGINFFRKFSDKADKDLFRKWVLAFCNLVERYLNGIYAKEEGGGDIEDIVDVAKEVFKTEKTEKTEEIEETEKK